MNFIQIQISQGVHRESCCTKDLIIFMNLKQHLTITKNGSRFVLKERDIVLINPASRFLLDGTDALFVRYTICMHEFRKIFPNKRYQFVCDSTNELNDNYDLLRRYLTSLLLVQYEEKEYQQAEWNKISYELLIFLVNNFTVTDFAAKDSGRLEDITDYIDANYQYELSLKQISRQFHMTPQYFSKYFKKNAGMNYYQYLITVRLEHAVDELLHQDKKILNIALDNGFPNAQSFHRYFVKAFSAVPQEYRDKYRKNMKKKQNDSALNLKRAVTCLYEEKHIAGSDYILEADASRLSQYEMYWGRVINIGNSDLLQDSEVQTQLDFLYQDLKFESVRMDLDWSRFNGTEGCSFYLEERKFDFLVKKGLTLWFTIQVRLLDDQNAMSEYLRTMLSHFANRYSINTIRQWKFELCFNTLFDVCKADEYWKIYHRIQKILQIYDVQEELMGPGMILGNRTGLYSFHKYMQEHGLKLPVQTFQAEPYIWEGTGESIYMKRATDSSYIKNQAVSLRHSSYPYSPKVNQICITRWTDSIMPVNIMNDSCYRGAAVIKNIIDCFGCVQLLAHSVPLDVTYTDSLQGKVLFGGDGLISKQRLKKPSFYAYSFMRHAGNYYLKHDKHSIIFGNGDADYSIICHNCKRLGYRYYLEEENLDYSNLDSYFDDLESLSLKYRITNLKNGTYVVKTRSVSTDHGSVQDELHRMAKEEEIYIHENDLDYLRQVSAPKMRLNVYKVTDGFLELQITLKANEFAYLHIIYQY